MPRRHPEAETSSRVSPELFRLFIDRITRAGICLVDPDGSVCTWNDGAARLLGYQRDEVIGTSFTRFLSPDEVRAGVPTGLLKEAAEHGCAEENVSLVRKDGSYFRANDTTLALRDQDGRLVAFAVVLLDLTAAPLAGEHTQLVHEQAARQEAEEAQRLVHDILESITDAFFAVDHDWRFTYVNRKAEQLWGMRRETLIGRKIWDVFPVAVGSTSYQELKHAESQHVAVAYEFLSPVLNHWVDVNAYPSANGLSVYFRDISERKRREEERLTLMHQLDAERGWLRAVIEQSPVGILLVEGGQGERVVANRRAEALFGRALPPEGGIGQYVGQINHPNGTALRSGELAVRRALQGQTVASEEELLRQPNGRDVRVLVSAVPIREADRITGAVVIYEDITRIRELGRQREEWTSAIAHDLRQPVSVITAYTSLLRRFLASTAGERECAAADHVLTAAWNLNKMIGDLLDVSRIGSRRLRLERRTIDLAALVCAVVERMAEIIDGHRARVELSGEIAPVCADPERIEQVLGNLLSNASKYSDPGTDILVRLAQVDGADRISVTNVGPGIPAPEMPRLFTRFYRTRQAQEGKVAGLGLGLYISRGIVEAHGGRIWAESTPGQTTTFYFSLPVEPVHGQMKAAPTLHPNDP